MDELKEKLSALVESAESYDDACDELSDAMYEIEEALDDSGANDELKGKIEAFLKKYDPILDRGNDMICEVDDLLQSIEDNQSTKN